MAVELERCASRAQARAGPEAAAAFLECAVELTPDSRLRGARAISAAQAKMRAGALAGGLKRFLRLPPSARSTS